MKKIHLVVTVMAGLVLLLSACSPEATPTYAPPSAKTVVPGAEMTVTTLPAGIDLTGTAMPGTDMTGTTMPDETAMPAPTGPANIMIGKNEKLGSFLQDDMGRTLYMFTKDTPNTSTCYDTCATSWLPLLTTGNPVAATGIDTSKLGTTQRTDGTMQVTYGGLPLYYFADDVNAGDTAGQNVSSLWFVISPEGEKINK